MMNDDKPAVSADLRAAESEIDTAYLDNPLTKLRFSESAWYFLAHCEERIARQIYCIKTGREEETSTTWAVLADTIMNQAKWPLRWLRKECRDGDVIPNTIDDASYEAAFDLASLASSYMPFEAVFTYATLRLLELRIEGKRILTSGTLRADTRYEAYDRLQSLPKSGFADPSPLIRRIEKCLRVRDDRFSYPLSLGLVRDTLEDFKRYLDPRFNLPSGWQMGEYSLGEFALVAKVLWIISLIHWNARIVAADWGCKGIGYSDSVFVMDVDELRGRIARFTDLDRKRVEAILNDMTYGLADQKSPDPALQPLIPLTSTRIAWAPSLVVHSALERNMTVLLNRKPESRSVYSKLSHHREDQLRSVVKTNLSGLGLRFWHGAVSGWKDDLDIDLAIIKDAERHCLIVELKSFIGPAEPRELRDRSEEIARGIGQIQRRQDLVATEAEPFYKVLGIDSAYALTWAVASETSVGGSWVQNESVPVVIADHLVRQLRSVGRLEAVSHWLRSRDYLPVEGRDYQTVDNSVTIAGWTLDWYGLRPLRNEFD